MLGHSSPSQLHGSEAVPARLEVPLRCAGPPAVPELRTFSYLPFGGAVKSREFAPAVENGIEFIRVKLLATTFHLDPDTLLVNEVVSAGPNGFVRLPPSNGKDSDSISVSGTPIGALRHAHLCCLSVPLRSCRAGMPVCSGEHQGVVLAAKGVHCLTWSAAGRRMCLVRLLVVPVSVPLTGSSASRPATLELVRPCAPLL